MSRARRDNQIYIETQAQRICEKIILSELFLKKLLEVITTQIPAMIESHIKVYKEKVCSLEERVGQLEQEAKQNDLRVYGVPDERSQDGSHD
ncbi:hypothetical protein JTB14_007843 [Gonioctena quinquepunctata]|nr:hypothetical protein JTB14_007843 [Gonioctena quinquepunctata]